MRGENEHTHRAEINNALEHNPYYNTEKNNVKAK